MRMLYPKNMIKATRLTGAGRLTEASTLLQRLVHGEQPADAAAPAPHKVASNPSGRLPRVTDVGPATAEASEPAPKGTTAGGQWSAGGMGWTTMPQRQQTLRGFFDQITQGELPQRSGGLPHGISERPAEAMPESAQFINCSFSGDTGACGYKLYIPSTYTGEAVPLVVMLHGCTQSPNDFAAGTRMNVLAEEHACLIVYPDQTQSANAQRCWNWFSPAHQRRDRGEPALIAGITRQVMRDYAVDPTRVYVGGLSAGAAAAAIMAQAYPDLYAAVGVHSGLTCGAARDISSALAAMRHGAAAPQCSGGGRKRRIIPTIVFHADNDFTVHPRNGDQVIAQSAAGGALRTEVQIGQVPGGHGYSRTVFTNAAGEPILEHWLVHGGGHAWSGGSPAGSYTNPRGPDASREMLRFFLAHTSGRFQDA